MATEPEAAESRGAAAAAADDDDDEEVDDSGVEAKDIDLVMQQVRWRYAWGSRASSTEQFCL